jgi:CMP-N-acetylneuraminic acid synthetase
MCEISIIIRTHNEERWIGQCLQNLLSQTYSDFEVILVDNLSTDKTVEKAKHVYPDLTLVQIDDYLPGLALNEGIKASEGEFSVCLSAHCIPVDEHWLENLRQNFDEYDDLAGVYGRQIPIESSDPVDKRDLIRTFGPEKRVQTQDTFFHNANSMVKRDIWDQYPFDDEVTNIEDQIWAHEVLNNGFKIVYEPDAAVYHHHGINQGNDRERARSVVQTMENNLIEKEEGVATEADTSPMDPSTIDIVSFIPLRQRVESGIDTNEVLIKQTLQATKESTYVDDVFIATDADYMAEEVIEWGASDLFIREPELSEKDVGVDEVYKFTLEQLEEAGRYPDLVVTLDITHPFRQPTFLDDIIEYTVTEGYDSTVPVYPEYRPSWMQDGNEFRHINESEARSNRDPILIGLNSLGVVAYPQNIRKGDRWSGDIGLYTVDNPLAAIEIHDRDDLKYWQELKEISDTLLEE